jgi:hypothetical protein
MADKILGLQPGQPYRSLPEPLLQESPRKEATMGKGGFRKSPLLSEVFEVLIHDAAHLARCSWRRPLDDPHLSEIRQEQPMRGATDSRVGVVLQASKMIADLVLIQFTGAKPPILEPAAQIPDTPNVILSNALTVAEFPQPFCEPVHVGPQRASLPSSQGIRLSEKRIVCS